MQNILIISQYRSTCGWGNAAKSYIRALATTRNNLSIRPVFMSEEAGTTPPDLLEFEYNSFKNYDVLIQNILPHYFIFDSRFGKNIGLCYTETDNLKHIAWPERINLLDELWVPSQADKRHLENSGVTIPIKLVPIPIDTSKFEKSYEKLKIPSTEDNFIFYFIGEFISRKGLQDLLVAFHTEFSPEESVSLLIKTSKSGLSEDVVAEQVVNYCEQVKKTIRIHGKLEDYKAEIVITEKLEEEFLYRLHNTCHCFVMPSKGESWNIPCMDALGFGNTPIVVDNTGPTDFINNDNGYVVNSYKIPVIITDPPIQDLYTGNEVWNQPDVLDLKKKMREAFYLSNYKNLNLEKRELGTEDVYNYSYEKIGQLMKELLKD